MHDPIDGPRFILLLIQKYFQNFFISTKTFNIMQKTMISKKKKKKLSKSTISFFHTKKKFQ